MPVDPPILIAIFFVVAKISLLIAAVVFLVSGLDEIFFDLYFFLRQSWRRLFIYRRYARLKEEQLLAAEEQPVAIFVPAWQEENVIRQMLANTVGSIEYGNFHIFVGCYPNDEATLAQVDLAAGDSERIHKVVCQNAGPTNKADNLNSIYEFMCRFERDIGQRFRVIIIHDSEDIVHPLSLKLINYLIPRFVMVQLPVYPLRASLLNFTTGIYIDEFAENHTKDLLVRERLDRSIPAAGVGCAFSRDSLDSMSRGEDGLPFNTTSLTEDYEFGIRLRELPGRKIFVKQAVEQRVLGPDGRERRVREVIATREIFPSRFRDAVAQRSRWTLGIAIQGWRSFGWQGPFFTRLMFYRDRKVLVTSIVSLLGYLAFFYFLTDRIAASFGAPDLFPSLIAAGSWLWPLIVIDTGIMVMRLLHRVAFVTRLYGLAHGLVSIPRVFWANVINFCATMTALGQFFGSLRSGRPVSWSKTSHEYPSEDELEQHRLKRPPA